MEKDLQFPEGFLWGTATSAYQIEGGIVNDWEVDQHVPNAGRATDHWSRYEEDLALAASLNTNAYRFSIEWARIEPQEGVFNEKAIAHYRAMIASMEAHGLEPFLTLHHFTHPVWFIESGGWMRRDAIRIFERFVERVVHDLGGSIRFWCTINEPLIYTHLVYVWHNLIDEHTGYARAFRVAHQLQKAHRAAYRTIKKRLPDAEVGIVKNNRPIFARGLWGIIRPFVDWTWNRWFLNGIRGDNDFIGLNYYHPSSLGGAVGSIAEAQKTDMGWPVWPQGFYLSLKDLRRYRVPIYITENGIADKSDRLRAPFIVQHLAALHHAIEEGVDVRGYFYWSLLDNFEWAEGYTKFFGLFAVDNKTLKRTKRPSADVYAEICRSNAVLAKFLKQHVL